MTAQYGIYGKWYFLTRKLRKAKVLITSARLSGDRSLIDIRYWLSRPDRLQKNYPLYLLDDATKERLYPANFVKFGTIGTKHGRNTTNGVVLFYNRNNLIKPGSKVVLTVDSLLSEPVEVF